MPDSSRTAQGTPLDTPLDTQVDAPLALHERLKAGRFVVTAEVAPPLAAGADSLLAVAAPLRGLADAVNVTDAAGARTAMSSLAAAAILQGAGFEAVMQITCRDRNRIGLAGDLLGAAALGVRNLLILHGDDPAQGDAPDAKPVYDLNSREVMSLARQMSRDGTLPSGRKIKSPPRFLVGAADSPHDPAPDWRPDALIAKHAAGAEFVQTQFCFDAAVARRYLARLGEYGLTGKLRFLIGVGPLASAASARWMNERLFGVTVPDAMIARLEGAEDQAAEGQRLCVELIEELRGIDGVAGVHIMAPRGGAAAIASVIGALGGR